jgi:predicted 2-oxoglutarate/Fe(II)-dependent dioxygenase YbiX
VREAAVTSVIKQVSTSPAANSDVRQSALAPDDRVLLATGCFDSELIDLVLRSQASGEWVDSPMVRPDVHGAAVLQPDYSAKARWDQRVTNSTVTAALAQGVAAYLLPTVSQWWGLSITAFESWKLVRYEPGHGWFGEHRDNTTPDAAHRQLALTIGLNSGYSGGELHFSELDESIVVGPGDAVIFPCSLLHCVRPVTSGERLAVISFLW